ncbi:MAG: hypothetical protein GY820_48630, partial [Gammaproteobacteria bacterium]|nr:hypothetical protein [Gammaproteobacteria bacterium]
PLPPQLEKQSSPPPPPEECKFSPPPPQPSSGWPAPMKYSMAELRKWDTSCRVETPRLDDVRQHPWLVGARQFGTVLCCVQFRA